MLRALAGSCAVCHVVRCRVCCVSAACITEAAASPAKPAPPRIRKFRLSEAKSDSIVIPLMLRTNPWYYTSVPHWMSGSSRWRLIARGEVGPLPISSQKTDPDSPENRVGVAARQVSIDICATWGLRFELSQRSCSRTGLPAVMVSRCPRILRRSSRGAISTDSAACRAASENWPSPASAAASVSSVFH